MEQTRAPDPADPTEPQEPAVEHPWPPAHVVPGDHSR
jgi:hypothetical protein